MKRAQRVRWIVYLILILTSLLSSVAGAQTEGQVLVMEVNGPVTPVMLSYIERGIEEAEGRSAEALVIMLNTPGGDVELTRKIIEAIISADVPVAVYVAPRGAFAASAGTFITLAGHVAAMAPNTSIGAASPISGQGEEISETLPSSPEPPNTLSVTAPPEEILAALREYAELGNFTGIQEFLDELQAADLKFQPFVSKIKEFADKFQFNQMIEFINSFMS